MIPDSLFLSDQQVRTLAQQHGTPLYVYGKDVLSYYAQQALMFKGPYGTTVRYAVKANPHKEIVKLFDNLGLHFDASSGGEVELLMSYGIKPDHIALNSQELPKNLKELVGKGVYFTATSLHQLDVYGSLLPGTTLGVRLNPGIGSGETNKVTTGGENAGFGIWHEYIEDVHKICQKHNLTIDKVHTHIGAGTDPAVWQRVAAVTLDLVEQIPSATKISLGGGFKVGRMDDEPTVDVPRIGAAVAKLLEDFAAKTGRRLHVEIEPGTYLTALGGLLIASVIDITDTGKDGYTFMRVNTGMNDILRPSLYGAQHPLWVITHKQKPHPELEEYVVIGHNCESGDLLTPQKGDPETLGPRLLQKAAIDDVLVIGGAGAYCASMRATGYNSFDPAPEIIV